MRPVLKDGAICPALSKPEIAAIEKAMEKIALLVEIRPIDPAITEAAVQATEGLKTVLKLCTKEEEHRPIIDAIEKAQRDREVAKADASAPVAAPETAPVA